METNIYATNQDSSCLTPAKCLRTPKEEKYQEYQRNIEEQRSPSEFQDVLQEPEMSLLSLSSILDHSETSLQPGGTVEHVSATSQSEAEQLCEGLLCSARHKPKEEALNFTSYPEWPLLAGKNPAKKPERSHEIRVIRHKPSAITFSNFEFLSHEATTKLRIYEAGEEDYSSEEEEADGRGDDDLFTKLPLYEAFCNGLHKTEVFPRKQAKWELTEYPHICHLEDSKMQLKDRDKEEKHMELETQSEKSSEWSDSMSCLMKKLEQLNLDIEEALSARSSPSSTPSTTKHKQRGF
ncbi:uncharacterized protein LOC136044750 [Cyrtonyx montezumae]|uniref:uncharacterized protein LOC136044750 n=1 Tax=Cyrtonyx montezumae TaxID=9017 RepID=UPI0032DA119C